ncbi:MAG: segregation/condensation protein A [Firmicutes bacterium]|nr:segregation/condensation protein A [Bacillota bacterium]
MDSLLLKLPVFEGPLDLLLHLIEKNKLDIYDIPILEITRQYLEYLKTWDEMDLEFASEFIVMAATLINIKAKKLLPAAEKADEEETDEEAELIRRLVEYKRYKLAAKKLKGLMDPTYQQIFEREPQTIRGKRPVPPPEDLMDGITLEELLVMYERARRALKESYDEIRAGFSSVKRESYSLADKIAHLQKSLELFEEVSFYSLRSKSHSKEETITFFMAMLELSRMNQIVLTQKSLFGDIIATKIQSLPEGLQEHGETFAET